MLAEGSLEQWLKEHDEMFARLDVGDYSAFEGLFVEVPDYVIEWWVNRPESLNGVRKDVLYFIYRNDTPPEVESWINSQSSISAALYHIERVIKEREEREELRKILGWI